MSDDDDLMDLDFTVPGAFETKAEPEPVSAPVPPPPPVRAPLPPALKEAAELFAGGKEVEAMRRI